MKPAVKITLDRERTLTLDMNAMAAFEEETGKSLISGTALGEMAMKDFRALLWACLVHEDESLTVKQVGALVHAGNLEEVGQAIAAAFERAMPEARGEAAPLPESRPAG